jgi:prepilin-type processing-associated H-X9-DG protein
MYGRRRFAFLLLLICAGITLFALKNGAQSSALNCTNNARQLVTAILNYAHDHNETLPPTTPPAAFQTALMPYVPGHSAFLCPSTNLPYAINPNLSGVSLASISDWGNTVLLRDAQPHSDGEYTVAYLDGYVTHGGVDLTPEYDCTIFQQKLVTSIQLYAQDYDDVLPPMQTPAIFKQALLPYTHDNRVFTCPQTNLPYIPNKLLSGIGLYTISDTGTTATLRDAAPHADGKVTLAYLDGYVTHGGVDLIPVPDCQRFLKEAVQGVMAYTQDYDEVFPPMKDPVVFKKILLPYTRDSRVFTCPETNLPYAFNTKLSGVTLASVSDRDQVVVARDAKAHTDGNITVGYLDGRIMYGGAVLPNNEAACLSNVKMLTLATIMYAQDYDEVLPPMNNYQTFRTVIYPYIGSNWPFHCPATGLEYTINSALSGVSLSKINNPSSTLLLQDTQPHANGQSTYGYVDGHAERH